MILYCLDLKCIHVRLCIRLIMDFPLFLYETNIKASIQLKRNSAFSPVLQRRNHVTNDTVGPAIKLGLMTLESPEDAYQQIFDFFFFFFKWVTNRQKMLVRKAI